MTKRFFNTLDEAADFMAPALAAQSMLFASVLRAFIAKGVISERDLDDALAVTEKAAMQRRTPETPALTGLIALLRRDLGLDATKSPDA